MMKRLFALFVLIGLGTAAGALAQGPVAQGSVAGQYEYMNHCAACHGIAADGKRPLVTFFRDPVPNLTRLQGENDGVFPFLETMMIIDGRSGLRGHGGAMPVWGDTFEAQAVETAGVYGAETLARGRLVSLVEYLVTVQQD